MKLTAYKITVKLNERAIVLVDGRPERYLEPGVHRLWEPFRDIEVKRYDTRDVVVDMTHAELQVVPETALRYIEVRQGQRVALRRRGVPFRWLRPGSYTLWDVERLERVGAGGASQVPAIEVETFDTLALEVAPLSAELRDVVASRDYVEALVPHGMVGLRYVDGRLEKVLGPGRYGAWATDRDVKFQLMDLREKELAVTGQDVMTKDRVSVRVNISAVFQVTNVELAAGVAQAPEAALYLAMQLAAREAIASRTLDEILADRDGLAGALEPDVLRRGAEVGLTVRSIGIKDLILPGAMKELMNKVIEAKKSAEANVILRREEIAATRSMAQTAKVLEENPTLMRLKELEAYKDLADKVGHVELIVGKEELLRLADRR